MSVIKKIKNDPMYGNASAKLLAKYEKEHPVVRPINVGIPLIDAGISLRRNHKEMKKVGIATGDAYFHCRGNFEASTKGLESAAHASVLGIIRELGQLLEQNNKTKEEKIEEYSLDNVANQMGIKGALSGKTLQESCPKDIKAYVKEMNKLYNHKK